MGLAQFMNPVTKAVPREQARQSPRVPSVFQPPASGGGYYGRWYRYEQARHYTGPSYIAIQAWISEIAGGEDPLIGRKKPKQAPVPGKAIRKSMSAHHEFEPLEHDDPMVKLFERPNDVDVGYDLWQYHTLFKQLQGVSYWWVRRNGFGLPKEIWVIPPHWLQLMTDREGNPSYYWVQAPWGHVANIPYAEVVSFISPSPLNPRWEGWAVNQAVAEWIDSYESLIRMRLAVWKNGAVPAFHVALGEAYMDPDDAFLARFYSKWFARFQGEDKSGLPLITGADVEVKTLDGHRPADALLATNESEQQTRDNTFAAFRVPGAIVGLTKDMTYGSVSASQDAFRTYSVDSELKYTGEVITQRIIKPTPGYEDGVLYWKKRATGDPAFKLQQHAQGLATGTLTVNEVRTEDGLEPYPNGGDNPMVGGVEMPWVREAQEEPMAAAFNRALSEGSGARGGFAANGHNGNGRKTKAVSRVMAEPSTKQKVDRVEKALARIEAVVSKLTSHPVINIGQPAVSLRSGDIHLKAGDTAFNPNILPAPTNTPGVTVVNEVNPTPVNVHVNPTPVEITNEVNPTPVEITTPTPQVTVEGATVNVVNEITTPARTVRLVKDGDGWTGSSEPTG